MASSSRSSPSDIFATFQSSPDASLIQLISASVDDLRLRVGTFVITVVDPLEGTPIVLADGPEAAVAFAERVNERTERMGGGVTFLRLLELLASMLCASTVGAVKRPPSASPMTAPGRRRIGASPGFDDDGEPGTEAEDDADISLPPPPGAGGRAAAAAAAAAHEEDLEEEEEGNEEADALEEEDEDDDEEEEDDDAHLAAEVAMAMAPGASAHDGQQGQEEEEGAAAAGPSRAAESFNKLQDATRGRAVSLSRRVQGDLLALMKGDAHKRGMHVSLADEDRLDAWRVKYTTFPDGSQLALDLAALTAAQEPHMPPACVECEMRLPTDYPFSPPSLRIVRPRFRKQTGYVINGALCMELLTPQGWNVTFSIEAILEQVRVFARTHARDPSLACMHARHTHIFSLAYMPFPQHAGTRPSRPRQGRNRDAA